MKAAVIVARTLVGLVFAVFGVNYFLHFIPLPPPDAGSPAAAFFGVLAPSGYLTAVKVFEIAGGVLLLTGRFAPLGVTLVTPVAVNILFYEVFLLHKPGLGYLLVPLCLFLVWGYRSHFRPVFAANATIG